MQLLFDEVVFKLFKDKFFVLSTSTPWQMYRFSSTAIYISTNTGAPGVPVFIFPCSKKNSQ